jgi:hypothetical protein
MPAAARTFYLPAGRAAPKITPMKLVRPVLSVAVFVPGFAVLGMFAAVDSFFPAWGGALIGGAIGVFFGLAFGGMLPRSVADFFFGPEQQEATDTEP